jgi:predicted RecA/RadA family phage recombinase
MSLSTYVGTGNLIDYTPAGAVSAGDIVVATELIGQVVSDLAAGQKGALRVEGAIRAPKLSSDVTAIGTKLYWDAGNQRMTVTASTHKQAGWALEVAADPSTEILLKLGKG